MVLIFCDKMEKKLYYGAIKFFDKKIGSDVIILYDDTPDGITSYTKSLEEINEIDKATFFSRDNGENGSELLKIVEALENE